MLDAAAAVVAELESLPESRVDDHDADDDGNDDDGSNRAPPPQLPTAIGTRRTGWLHVATP